VTVRLHTEVTVMSAEAAVTVLHRRTLAATPDSERAATVTRLVAEHQRRSGGVARGLALGVVDEIIDPALTH